MSSISGQSSFNPSRRRSSSGSRRPSTTGGIRRMSRPGSSYGGYNSRRFQSSATRRRSRAGSIFSAIQEEQPRAPCLCDSHRDVNILNQKKESGIHDGCATDLHTEQLIELSNGVKMPEILHGLWIPKGNIQQMGVENLMRAVVGGEYRTIKRNTNLGLRGLDVSFKNGHEKLIGRALETIFAKKGIYQVERDNLFISGKLWPTFFKVDYQNDRNYVREALDTSLKNLGLKYFDLYMVHFPCALEPSDETLYPDLNSNKDSTTGELEGQLKADETTKLTTVWSELEVLYLTGKIRSLGLCNVNLQQLKSIVDRCFIKPQVVQLELHPFLRETEIREYCLENNIHVQAHCPIFWGKKGSGASSAADELRRPSTAGAGLMTDQNVLQGGTDGIAEQFNSSRSRPNTALGGRERYPKKTQAQLSIKPYKPITTPSQQNEGTAVAMTGHQSNQPVNQSKLGVIGPYVDPAGNIDMVVDPETYNKNAVLARLTTPSRTTAEFWEKFYHVHVKVKTRRSVKNVLVTRPYQHFHKKLTYRISEGNCFRDIKVNRDLWTLQDDLETYCAMTNFGGGSYKEAYDNIQKKLKGREIAEKLKDELSSRQITTKKMWKLLTDLSNDDKQCLRSLQNPMASIKKMPDMKEILEQQMELAGIKNVSPELAILLWLRINKISVVVNYHKVGAMRKFMEDDFKDYLDLQRKSKPAFDSAAGEKYRKQLEIVAKEVQENLTLEKQIYSANSASGVPVHPKDKDFNGRYFKYLEFFDHIDYPFAEGEDRILNKIQAFIKARPSRTERKRERLAKMEMM